MRDPIVNIAVQAARVAGNIIMRAADRPSTIRVSEKSSNDYVTDIDQLAEQEIINVIRKAHPNHSILGEECGKIEGNDYVWIIDPIDGTRNFIHGFPHFAVSIALSYKGRILHGVIYDPVRQDLFTATRGKGAQLNERRIRVGKQTSLENSLIGTSYPPHDSSIRKAAIQSIQGLLPACSALRNNGAATLDLAYVASGRLDGCIGFDLKLWDMAAGILLIKEAGGLVCDLEGGEDYLKTGHIIATNPKILKSLLKIINTVTLSS